MSKENIYSVLFPVLYLIASGIAYDLILNNGESISNIIKAFKTPKK